MEPIALSGRIDTNNAAQVQADLEKKIGDNKKVVFDLSDLDYISSAGLRIFIILTKRGKEIELINTPETIKDIFVMTGLSSVLKIN